MNDLTTLAAAGRSALGACRCPPASSAQGRRRPTARGRRPPTRSCSGTSSCSASRPRPATSPRPSIRPTSWRSCTRRSTTRSSRSITRDAVPAVVHAPRDASVAAAADTAAHDTLVALYPACGPRSTSSTRRLLAQLPAGGAQDPRASASASRSRPSCSRAARTTAPTPRPSRSCPAPSPGDYQLDAARVRPAGVHPLALVRPFVAAPRRTSSGRPPPPALTSAEVRRRAQRGQGARRRDRLDADGRPDGDRPVLEPADLGDLEPHRADRRARAPRQPVATNARTFAALNLTFADSVIAFYDAKYTYRLWRPVTAIRAPTPTATPTPSPTRLDAALDHGAGPLLPRRARHDQRRRRRGAALDLRQRLRASP